MTDRELLELAAKAAKVKGHYHEYCGDWGLLDDLPDGFWWNAITDDGDALRLAVALNLSVDFFSDGIRVGYTADNDDIVEQIGDDPCAASRRAIVRAAAEIGKKMTDQPEGYWCVVCGRFLPADDGGVVVHDDIIHPKDMNFADEENPQ